MLTTVHTTDSGRVLRMRGAGRSNTSNFNGLTGRTLNGAILRYPIIVDSRKAG